MSEEIIVDIDTEGGVEISVNGHHGSGCKDLTKGLEKALGSVKDRELTADYYKPRKEVNRQQIGRG